MIESFSPVDLTAAPQVEVFQNAGQTTAAKIGWKIGLVLLALVIIYFLVIYFKELHNAPYLMDEKSES